MSRDDGLTHLDGHGSVQMVDVGDKPVTNRQARAEGRVMISAELARAIRTNELAKGNLLEVARIAGIQAAKRTDELIPLCHSLPLDVVYVEASLHDDHVHLIAEVHTQARTGVEMEALTAVAAAALTVVDMGKAVDRAMRITDIRVTRKSGGRSGVYQEREP